MSGTNWFDAVVAAALIYGIWSGVRAGFSGEILRLVGLILMVVVAANTYEMFGAWFAAKWNIDAGFANLAAFVGVGLVVYLVVLLIRVAVHKRMQQLRLGAVLENFGGGVAGWIRMVIIMAAVSVVLALTGSGFWHQQVARESRFGSAVVSYFPAIEEAARKHLPEKFWLSHDFKRRRESIVTSDSATAAKSGN